MIIYKDNLCLIFKLRGSVVPMAALKALFGTCIAFLLKYMDDADPNIREKYNLTGLGNSSVVWNAMTAAIAFLITLRIKQALGRFWEGSSLLHQMRGEWFDAASCLVTFSRDAKLTKGMAEDVSEFRNTLIRLMSLMHGSALDEISRRPDDSYEVIDIQGIDTTTLLFLQSCQARCNFSKVEALQHLIQVLVTENFHKGVLTIPPPILSRIYQTLSRGFVNLLNARKIKDTMFPLPFAQATQVLLLLHSIFTPAMMAEIMESKLWAALFTFVPLLGLHCLNLAALRLEVPFGTEANDLPLVRFQEEMNDTLLMLIEEEADHLPVSSEFAQPRLTRECHKVRVSIDVQQSQSRSMQRQSWFDWRSSRQRLRSTFRHPDSSSRCRTVTPSNTKSFQSEGFFSLRRPSSKETFNSQGDVRSIEITAIPRNLRQDTASDELGSAAPVLLSSDLSPKSGLMNASSTTPVSGYGEQLGELSDQLRHLDSLVKIITEIETTRLSRYIQSVPNFVPESPKTPPWQISTPRPVLPNGQAAVSVPRATPTPFAFDCPAKDSESIYESR